MDYKEAWVRYCAVKGWKQAGKHVEWACEQEGDTVVVFLQGSYEAIDWVRDFEVWPTRLAVPNGCAHHGFARMYSDLVLDGQFRHDVLNCNATKIVFVGYSSGGAIAGLCAYYAGLLCCFHVVGCFTFAAPQVLWMQTSRFFQGVTTNVRLDRDIVPHVLGLLGYRRIAGTEVVLKSLERSPLKSHLPASYSEAILRS